MITVRHQIAASVGLLLALVKTWQTTDLDAATTIIAPEEMACRLIFTGPSDFGTIQNVIESLVWQIPAKTIGEGGRS